MTTGKEIRAARAAQGLTQAQLAERAGCAQADVFRIEKGEVSNSKYLLTILRILRLDTVTHISVPLIGYVGANCEVRDISDGSSPDGTTEQIPAPPGLTNGIALVVRGDSMEPKYSDGEILFIEKTIYSVDGLIGENCYVLLADGSRYVKKLQRGTQPGLYTLISYNGPPIHDVPVEAAYPIAFTKPCYRNLK